MKKIIRMAGVILVLLLYQLDKKYDKIMGELMEREARGVL